MMSKKAVKIICIVLAVLMGLSVLAVLLQTFAISAAVPATGVEDHLPLFIGIALACLLIIVLCLILPKLKKKNGKENGDKE